MNIFRQICIFLPNFERICEGILFLNGILNYEYLAKKITFFFNYLNEIQNIKKFGLENLKMLINKLIKLKNFELFEEVIN